MQTRPAQRIRPERPAPYRSGPPVPAALELLRHRQDLKSEAQCGHWQRKRETSGRPQGPRRPDTPALSGPQELSSACRGERRSVSSRLASPRRSRGHGMPYHAPRRYPATSGSLVERALLALFTKSAWCPSSVSRSLATYSPTAVPSGATRNQTSPTPCPLVSPGAVSGA